MTATQHNDRPDKTPGPRVDGQPQLPPLPGQDGPPPFQISSTVTYAVPDHSVLLQPGTEPQIKIGQVPLRSYDDITYAARELADGSTLELKLDLRRPDDGRLLPLVVYVPGGGFLVSARQAAPDLRSFVAESGFVVAGIDYRTSLHGATYVDGARDAHHAVRYLRSHAAEFAIDPARVGVWGESAGGYLAALTGTTNGDTRFGGGAEAGVSGDVEAVVDKFGGADLSRIAADFDEETQEFFAGPNNSIAWYVFGQGSGKTFDQYPEQGRQADPATHISPATPPFLLLHGTDDHLVSPSQTHQLQVALRAAGIENARYLIDNARHGDLAFLGEMEAGLPWSTQTVMGLIIDFLDKHLRS